MRYKVQSLRELREEMKAVARGEKPAPADASKSSFNSVDAIIRLLTPENRRLLTVIRDEKPESVAALAKKTGRKSPNLVRTLAKFEAAGMVRIYSAGRVKKPQVVVKSVKVVIDPFRTHDQMIMKVSKSRKKLFGPASRVSVRRAGPRAAASR